MIAKKQLNHKPGTAFCRQKEIHLIHKPITEAKKIPDPETRTGDRQLRRQSE